MTPPTPARNAAGRLLSVLAAFDRAAPALTLSEIGRRAGLPLPTAHRLLSELTGWGALERDADGVYHVGLRLFELGTLAPRGPVLREAALPYLEDLYEATRENVQLAVREGGDAVYVERLAGRSSVGVRTQVGAHWPLHATGVGLALLAHAPADFQNDYLAAGLTAFTPWTVTDPDRLRRMLAEVRRAGLAVSDRQITPDAVSVAAPVRGAAGAVVAAVSIVVRAPGNPAALGPAVLLAARSISRALAADRPGAFT
ncbi:IclR family transcriptional regulator [Kitasatospora sp. NPDC006697]|uniref:IclR family transcriptional regulator n=1 Tax=Kitasatospora sp. NPDC006697 TaxID=3364020 RepID=UPI0036924E6D